MSKLYNFTFWFKGKGTYTAETREEALDKLYDEYGDVEVYDNDTDSFDPDEDDYMG